MITIEEALPHEVTGTADVAKLITESGLEMADRLVHTEYALLRDVVDSAANSLRRHDGGKPVSRWSGSPQPRVLAANPSTGKRAALMLSWASGHLRRPAPGSRIGR